MCHVGDTPPTKIPENPKPEYVERGIRRLPNGSFEVRVHVARDSVTGRSKQVSRTVRGIRAARSMRAKLEAEVGRGEHGGTVSTFGFLLDAWQEHRRKLRRSPTTLVEDQRKIDKDIRPALGAVRLDKLSTRHLDNFYGDMRERGLSEQTVLHLHRIIHAALAQAIRWKWVARNVANDTTKITVRPREKTTPRPADVQALIAEAARTGRTYMDQMLTVGALSGLRPGELCGLRLCDVLWDEGAIVPRQTVWQRGARIGTKAPKSRTGEVKPLPVHELAMAVLAGRRAELENAAEVSGVPLSPTAYIWSRDPLGSTPLRPTSVGQAFRRIRDRAGVAGRLYDATRHFHATELIASGADVHTVSERMRHSDPAFTMRTYVAGREELSRAAADRMGASLMPELEEGKEE